MSLLKKIFWKILVIAILSVSVKCGATGNHINISLSLRNSTKTEWINDILNAIEGKFGDFETTATCNVSKYAENVSVQMDKFQQAVDTKLITIESKYNELAPSVSNLVDKFNAVEGKFDAFEATVSSNVSKYAENVSVQMDKFQQAVDTKLITIESKYNELAPSVSNLVDKFNAVEGKFDAFEATVSSNVSKYAENVSVQMDKFQQAVDTKLITMESKYNELAPSVSNLVDKFNAVEGKFDAFEATVSSNVSKYAENVSVQMDKFQQAVDTKLITMQGKFDAFEATVSNFVRDIKETLFKQFTSCTNIFANPFLNRGSGIYNIQLNENSSPFAVYCLADPKGGLPWTVVQRRVDASVDFYRNWTEYKAGFGDLNNNFFIGLDHLYSLTNTAGPQELWVKLTDPDGITAHAYYDLFAIGNEDELYALKALGEFSGDAGDSLSEHIGDKFSTFDRDNDDYSGKNCAQYAKGAWWYMTLICHLSNLNGMYGSTEFDKGVTWHYYRGSEVSMRYAHMAIRPIRK